MWWINAQKTPERLNEFTFVVYPLSKPVVEMRNVLFPLLVMLGSRNHDDDNKNLHSMRNGGMGPDKLP
ncbi:hypothetical protein N7516_009979 [Penicillium verrucosum]|uniref:uncharacterized protein n=1 Tax=Penicillium verrucosum TaxID=60171 RepID=UPI0025456CC9|nr:uncharacterized protein N7516_009979 [Penicillium verrucosum]KAJ5922276.1 hypothetical protein N7516_009979 [Penicillium verrucosum]